MELWPDSEPAPRRESLVSQLLAGLRARRSPDGALRAERPDWRFAVLAGLAIAAGPLALWLSAAISGASIERSNQSLRAQLAPRAESKARNRVSRREIALLAQTPGLAATIDALARAVPANANVLRLARAHEGVLEVDIATPDPDMLLATLRRHPLLAQLKAVGQRSSDGMVIVSLAGPSR
ncbi:hypothetical protein [Sphingosinithalassobacter portus]|uniref:hypothetical protein n=1 Tax=Stakelama portus TaxID=2676234 RepID=UPI000D6DFB67|nr:hypothetical protein [Sphingosinithalassobacter portus]